MKETMIRVFVYGSLLPGEHNHHVVSPYIAHSVPGRVAGRLVDVGSYPALVRDATAQQQGSITRGLWLSIPSKALSVLDELEDFSGWEESNDYDRIWVRDVDNPSIQGWVYVWESDRGCPSVDGVNWPEYYALKQRRSRS
ncbi:gamma-glutamylcyclotransferase [Paenibacillus sp. CCS19]|uniref:gamma-glutamylcyclotransferase family protein n=1 Tax=Paenibacillus sp. CCS19 TaxID=3158387 RepID=UPI002564EC0C|nr:gamma-glutamylcyclotransferase family protein [Paenibacillus cellulosilyticus]GMK41820.1 gamma-glutamylcyclotransferase [Paenibacillus cellulosilyticus]